MTDEQIKVFDGAMAMKICLPKHIQELYQCYTSAANIPRLGVDDNCYFQALQLNISPAIPWERRFVNIT